MLLRIFLGENARFHHRPLYEAIVLEARAAHLAGATVIRGPMGLGRVRTGLHSTKILDVAEHLPMVIEIVDAEDKIKAFLPVLGGMMRSGLVTLEKVQVLQYGQRGQARACSTLGIGSSPGAPGHRPFTLLHALPGRSAAMRSNLVPQADRWLALVMLVN